MWSFLGHDVYLGYVNSKYFLYITNILDKPHFLQEIDINDLPKSLVIFNDPAINKEITQKLHQFMHDLLILLDEKCGHC